MSGARLAISAPWASRIRLIGGPPNPSCLLIDARRALHALPRSASCQHVSSSSSSSSGRTGPSRLRPVHRDWPVSAHRAPVPYLCKASNHTDAAPPPPRSTPSTAASPTGPPAEPSPSRRAGPDEGASPSSDAPSDPPRHPHDGRGSHGRRFRPALSARLRLAVRGVVLALQMLCLGHVINSQLFEVRSCTGASMLPTLSTSSDVLLYVRVPLLQFVDRAEAARMRWWRRLARGGWGTGGAKVGSGQGGDDDDDGDATEGTTSSGFGAAVSTKLARHKPSSARPGDLLHALQLGDLVVAVSPLDPGRPVCKRIVGLPGDTVLVDPRLASLAPSPSEAMQDAGRKRRKRRQQRRRQRGGGEDDDDDDDDGGESLELGGGSRHVVESAAEREARAVESIRAAWTTRRRHDFDDDDDDDDGRPDPLAPISASPSSSPAPPPSPPAAAPSSSPPTTTTTSLGKAIAGAAAAPRYVTVPQGHVWLGGDNLGNSTDSRHYGPVPLALIRGKVVARVFPRFQRFHNPLRFYDAELV